MNPLFLKDNGFAGDQARLYRDLVHWSRWESISVFHFQGQTPPGSLVARLRRESDTFFVVTIVVGYGNILQRRFPLLMMTDVELPKIFCVEYIC